MEPRPNPWDQPDLKEMTQNAVVLCGAAYAEKREECEAYLVEKWRDHSIENVVWSVYGRTKFLLGEDIKEKKLYITFRKRLL